MHSPESHMCTGTRAHSPESHLGHARAQTRSTCTRGHTVVHIVGTARIVLFWFGGAFGITIWHTQIASLCRIVFDVYIFCNFIRVFVEKLGTLTNHSPYCSPYRSPHPFTTPVELSVCVFVSTHLLADHMYTCPHMHTWPPLHDADFPCPNV